MLLVLGVLSIGSRIELDESSTPKSIKSCKVKGYRELMLEKNAILARYGYPFKTHELYRYFRQFDWYEPKPNFSFNDIPEKEKQLIKKLIQQEKEALKNNYQNGRLNWDNVWNTFLFGKFSREEIDRLEKNGFIVVPQNYWQFWEIYEENYYNGVPNFITTDSMLQLYNIYVNYLMRDLEEKVLSKELEELLELLLEKIDAALQDEVYPRDMICDLLKLKTYITVSLCLLTGKSNYVDMLPSEFRKIGLEEIRRCEECKGLLKPILSSEKQLDYSQFRVRGHYTRKESLMRYFKGMLWCSYYPFAIKEGEDDDLLTVLLLSDFIFNDDMVRQKWKKIDKLLTLLAGQPDDLGPDDIWNILKKENINIKNLKKRTIQRVRKEIIALHRNKARIMNVFYLPGQGYVCQSAQVKLLPQRYSPDMQVLQEIGKLKNNYLRIMPSGLDVMSVLGSKTARALAKRDWRNKKIIQKVNELSQKIKKTKDTFWKSSLNYAWLRLLTLCWEYNWKEVPQFFAKTKAWQYKCLNEALASWAELSHNMLLYRKQGIAAECGDGEETEPVWHSEPPKGYVEPNVVLWEELENMFTYTAKILKECGCFYKPWNSVTEEIMEKIKFLKRISVIEVKKEKITNKEYAEIMEFGGWLENISKGIITYWGGTPWMILVSTDKKVSLISDVFAAGLGSVSLKYLEEAVGPVYEIFVVVEIDGRLKLTRGGVFSYYEFVSLQRIKDEEWQEIVDTDNPAKINVKGYSIYSISPCRRLDILSPPDWTFIYQTSTPHYLPPSKVDAPWGVEAGWWPEFKTGWP